MLIGYYASIVVRKILRKCSNRESVKCFGEMNADKTIYIVTQDNDHAGLLSYVSLAIGHIAYAKKKGFYPVIDMMNFSNTYLDVCKIGVENSWEYYFEQPDNISLQDAYSSKNVIMSSGAPAAWPNTGAEFILYKKLVRNYWKKIVKQYIRIRPDVLAEVERQVKKKISSQDRVLGVLCRGTDYVALKPRRHPRQPSPEMVIKKAKRVMKKYNCNKLYLATEDKKILEMFEKAFPDVMIPNDSELYDYDNVHFITEMKKERENDAYLQGLEYLVSLLILARCNCFIGGRTGGTVGTLLFAEEYEYEYVWNLGRYM